MDNTNNIVTVPKQALELLGAQALQIQLAHARIADLEAALAEKEKADGKKRPIKAEK